MKSQLLIISFIIILISCTRLKPLIIVNNSNDTITVTYNHELNKNFPCYFYIIPYNITKINYDYVMTDKYVINNCKWKYYRPYEIYKNYYLDTISKKTYVYIYPQDSVELNQQFTINSEVNLITSKMSLLYKNQIIEGLELFEYIKMNDKYNIIEFDSLISKKDSFNLKNNNYLFEFLVDSISNFKKVKTLNIYKENDILREYNTFDSTLSFINYKKNIIHDKEYFITHNFIDSIYVYSKFSGKFKYRISYK